VVNRLAQQGISFSGAQRAAWRIAESTNRVCLDVEHSQPTMRPA